MTKAKVALALQWLCNGLWGALFREMAEIPRQDWNSRSLLQGETLWPRIKEVSRDMYNVYLQWSAANATMRHLSCLKA
ncbi:hypothetical protein ACQKWADRAFT_279122, partial [Trichoderma austrokoningii]